MTLAAAKIRYSVEPYDVPASKAARRLHLTLKEFRSKLPELKKRGFPQADPTTGHYYLPAIDQWMAARYNQQQAQDDSEIDHRLERAWGG
jgi:hypothetical protein